jgi:hypothetical protein
MKATLPSNAVWLSADYKALYPEYRTLQLPFWEPQILKSRILISACNSVAKFIPEQVRGGTQSALRITEGIINKVFWNK